jgi:hypothetical protein
MYTSKIDPTTREHLSEDSSLSKVLTRPYLQMAPHPPKDVEPYTPKKLKVDHYQHQKGEQQIVIMVYQWRGSRNMMQEKPLEGES